MCLLKKLIGKIKKWDAILGKGEIEGNDGKSYPFTRKEWVETDHEPGIHGGVHVVCSNGRDASKVELRRIEQVNISMISQHPGGSTSQGDIEIGGPRRMYSDARAWMSVANGVHRKVAVHPIHDISGPLLGEHLLISLRGSVVKYCYGFSMELYLKWILTRSRTKYKSDHNLSRLIKKLPVTVLDNLRGIYKTFLAEREPKFTVMRASNQAVTELEFDWSTFDNFINNLDHQQFLRGRYAEPNIYSIFEPTSEELSSEMNSYIDSDDFFELADRILGYEPPFKDLK